jgi:hypothetical protein
MKEKELLATAGMDALVRQRSSRHQHYNHSNL